MLPPLLVDECCRRRLIEALREHGVDVVAVWEVARGAKDPDVLQLAVAEGRQLRRREHVSPAAFGPNHRQVGGRDADSLCQPQAASRSRRMHGPRIVQPDRNHGSGHEHRDDQDRNDDPQAPAAGPDPRRRLSTHRGGVRRPRCAVPIPLVADIGAVRIPAGRNAPWIAHGASIAQAFTTPRRHPSAPKISRSPLSGGRNPRSSVIGCRRIREERLRYLMLVRQATPIRTK